ncbi:hypothetical protein FNV43_RR03867 [Rhamnella rubrinervis]|uniref:Uncharacterized protein n=1 Tax=Rhamnella rubrinervis TaxID=2594499 RepID=A0A8K0MP95_9ROSA|nr:hypothetical protein FNV43_RR03867 [Rhamnella rubrinervis]
MAACALPSFRIPDAPSRCTGSFSGGISRSFSGAKTLPQDNRPQALFSPRSIYFYSSVEEDVMWGSSIKDLARKRRSAH